MTPTFTIITPTWNRADGRLQRCIESVYTQRFPNYEHIIVDDGSTDDTRLEVEIYIESVGNRLRYVPIQHAGRIVARNKGMEAARGEWLCWLDSDDAYDPMYLATFAHNIKRNPDARLWVCGAVVHGVAKEDNRHTVPVWTQIRPAWMPPVNSNGVHSHFPSGTIGTGMFVFHRECYEKVGPLPSWANHNEVADGVDEWLGYETGYNSATRPVGNPWGDDWAYLRRLTQFYRVHLIEAALYVHYVR